MLSIYIGAISMFSFFQYNFLWVMACACQHVISRRLPRLPHDTISLWRIASRANPGSLDLTDLSTDHNYTGLSVVAARSPTFRFVNGVGGHVFLGPRLGWLTLSVILWVQIPKGLSGRAPNPQAPISLSLSHICSLSPSFFSLSLRAFPASALDRWGSRECGRAVSTSETEAELILQERDTKMWGG